MCSKSFVSKRQADTKERTCFNVTSDHSLFGQKSLQQRLLLYKKDQRKNWRQWRQKKVSLPFKEKQSELCSVPVKVVQRSIVSGATGQTMSRRESRKAGNGNAIVVRQSASPSKALLRRKGLFRLGLQLIELVQLCQQRTLVCHCFQSHSVTATDISFFLFLSFIFLFLYLPFYRLAQLNATFTNCQCISNKQLLLC